MVPQSIRWRLQLWLGFLLLCVLSGFVVAVDQLQRANRFAQIDEELEHRVAALSGAVRGGPFGPGRGRPPFEGRPGGSESEESSRPPPPPRRADSPPPGFREMRPGPRELRLSSEVASLFDGARADSFYFTVWSWDGSVIKRSTNAPVEVLLPERPGRDTRTHPRMEGAMREAYHFTERGDCVLAGRFISGDLGAMRRFTGWLLVAGGTVLALGLAGGWWLTTHAIRPVEEITAAASRISAGNLSERIRGADADNELGRLAGVLNSTFSRLESAFVQQKQFTADASHELRTPLAVIISEAQATLARERSAAEYRETVEACLDTAQQMRRLTESLLELARFDVGQGPIPRGPVDLAETASAGVERVRPFAAGHGIQIHCDLAPAKVFGNPDRLGQVLTNLLNNAIQYNQPDGQIRVNTRIDQDAAILEVADTGQGIAAEDLPHIFERFYRADKSRSLSQGRCGLGLAICKAIVASHGGSIEVSSQPGAGSTFTVRLPSSEAFEATHARLTNPGAHDKTGGERPRPAQS